MTGGNCSVCRWCLIVIEGASRAVMGTGGCCFGLWDGNRHLAALDTRSPYWLFPFTAPSLPSLDTTSIAGCYVVCLIILASSCCKAIAQYPNSLVTMSGNMAEGLRGVGGIKNLAVYPALLWELDMEQLFKKGNGGLVGGFTRDLALWPFLYPLFILDPPKLQKTHSL